MLSFCKDIMNSIVNVAPMLTSDQLNKYEILRATLRERVIKLVEAGIFVGMSTNGKTFLYDTETRRSTLEQAPVCHYIQRAFQHIDQIVTDCKRADVAEYKQKVLELQHDTMKQERDAALDKTKSYFNRDVDENALESETRELRRQLQEARQQLQESKAEADKMTMCKEALEEENVDLKNKLRKSMNQELCNTQRQLQQSQAETSCLAVEEAVLKAENLALKHELRKTNAGRNIAVRKLGRFIATIKEEVANPSGVVHSLLRNATDFVKQQNLRSIAQDTS